MKSLNRIPVVVALAILPLAVGCGDDGTSFAGVYEASTWTRNEAGCGSEGPSVLADEFATFFYVKNSKFFGQKFIGISFCETQAECEIEGMDEELLDLSGFALDSGSDDSGWTGDSFFGSTSADGTCEGMVTTARLTGTSTTVRLEARRIPVSGVPKDSDGFCDFDKAKQVAAGNDCAELEVIGGDLRSAL